MHQGFALFPHLVCRQHSGDVELGALHASAHLFVLKAGRARPQPLDKQRVPDRSRRRYGRGAIRARAAAPSRRLRHPERGGSGVRPARRSDREPRNGRCGAEGARQSRPVELGGRDSHERRCLLGPRIRRRRVLCGARSRGRSARRHTKGVWRGQRCIFTLVGRWQRSPSAEDKACEAAVGAHPVQRASGGVGPKDWLLDAAEHGIACDPVVGRGEATARVSLSLEETASSARVPYGSASGRCKCTEAGAWNDAGPSWTDRS